MGATHNDIQLLQKTGFNDWIQQQIMRQTSLTEPYIEALQSYSLSDKGTPPSHAAYHRVMSAGNYVGHLNFGTAWMRTVLNSNDQLRQRVAWALSQLFVISNRTNKLTEATANYYDVLLNGAFSDYESLLLNVTYHPLMGRYLSYIGNRKANVKKNRFPDENFAREVMQLFTIGLWMLNDDGSQLLDDDGNPIPTYSNDDVKELARVFTGFKLADERFGKIIWDKYDQPMQISAWHHDRGSKLALNGIIK